MLKDIVKTNWLNILFLSIVCYIVFLHNLGSYPLFDVDEPRYAETAREILITHNWITPFFNFEPRFAKPILFYWMIAVSYLTFGINEFAARLPSALCAYLTVVMTYITCTRIVNKQLGLIVSLVLATSLEFMALARMSITDMTLATFMSGALLTGFLAMHTEARERKIWWYTFYTFIGLAILTKGPVGLVLPGIVLALFCLSSGTFKQTLKTAELLPGLVLMLLISLPWYILVILENGKTYIDQFFLVDNFQRFTNTVSGHKGSPFFYFIVLGVGFIPWILFLPSACWHILTSCWHFMNSVQGHIGQKLIAYTASLEHKDRLVLYSFLWFIVIFTFFTCAGTKLLTYILPLFPAVAILVGYYIWQTVYLYAHTRAFLIKTTLFSIIIIGFSYFVSVHLQPLLPDKIQQLNLREDINSSVSVLLAGVVFLIIFTLQQQFLRIFLTITVMIVCLTFTAVRDIVPKVNKLVQDDLPQYIQIANNYENRQNHIIMFGMFKPSVVFYTKRQIPHYELEQVNDLKDFTQKEQKTFVITKNKFSYILEQNGFMRIHQGARYSLFSHSSVQLKGA